MRLSLKKINPLTITTKINAIKILNGFIDICLPSIRSSTTIAAPNIKSASFKVGK